VRILLSILILLATLNPSFSQAIDYEAVFGDAWEKAQSFEKENRTWMEPILTKNNISYPLAIAVIFPELVRYSALRDKMEIALLKTLYINLGDDYANFSIGHFQMKPSFAEMIHTLAPATLDRKSVNTIKGKKKYSDIINFRKSIVMDLEDPRTQFSYLILFLKICNKKYNIDIKDEPKAVKFLSTAYNYGIDKSASQIENMTDAKYFNTKLFKTENYSYADVSLFWYNQFIKCKTLN
jgi:hypothetical protein